MNELVGIEPVGIESVGVARARSLLGPAQWAAHAYAGYSQSAVQRVVTAVADAGAARAHQFATRAVLETGRGVMLDTLTENLAASTGLLERHRGYDFVHPRVGVGWVDVPAPVGLVLALTSATSSTADVFSTALLALMTRNAVVFVPHPDAAAITVAAVQLVAAAAVAAGAPQDIVQVVTDPDTAVANAPITIAPIAHAPIAEAPIAEALIADTRIDLVLIRDARSYPDVTGRSGVRVIDHRPGAVPAYVDASADVARAAAAIVASAAFDHSQSGGGESVLIVHEAVAAALLAAATRAGAFVLDEDQCGRLRSALFPGGQLDPKLVGQSAHRVAQAAGVSVPIDTCVLLAPVDMVVPEELLAGATFCPVLAVVRVGSSAGGIAAARAVLRLSGSGGEVAAVHATDPRTILDFATAVNVRRISVNTGTNGSGSAAAVAAEDLLTLRRLTHDLDPALVAIDLTGLSVGSAPSGPVPAYPVAANAGAVAAR